MNYILVVQSILQRPAQENIADVTQCIVDGLFIHGIGKALSHGAQFAKVYLLGAAESMTEVIAPHLMHEPFHFATTSAGDVVACIDRTGEIIKDVAQVAGAAVVDGTILAAQGNNLYNKVNNSGGGGNGDGNNSKKLDKASQRKEAPSWDDTTKDFFDHLKKNSTKKGLHHKFGNLYKNPETGQWWSKDHGGHSGSHYKVFKETSRGLEWIHDADLLGTEILDKHKSTIGRFIPWKEISFKS